MNKKSPNNKWGGRERERERERKRRRKSRRKRRKKRRRAVELWMHDSPVLGDDVATGVAGGRCRSQHEEACCPS